MLQRLAGLLAFLLLGPAAASADDFDALRARAQGQTVYFNAWGGSLQINEFIAWAGRETKMRYGVDIVHVKLTDTAEAVARVLAEKAAGRDQGGSIDLIWINGENFRAMKQNDLLFGPFVADLPNFAYVDTKANPTTLVDFTIPTDGLEAPWGMAQFVLFHDTARVPEPPRNIDALIEWALANPGRFTFPAPPDFIGSTFLKHVLYAAVDERERLLTPVDAATFDALTPGVWERIDRLRPALWRQGRTYPANKEALHQLLEDGEIDLSMAFNPAEASSLILNGRLPDTVRTFVLEDGTIANTHFLAIPYNASSPEGAMVVANFLLSPEAQARKQDPQVWGDPTVLGMALLSSADRALFEELDLGPATLTPAELGPALPEPHPSWMVLLEQRWTERYVR
jgi:putative thiamine transport system substrate-binding protein